jgi:hypothetical protein
MTGIVVGLFERDSDARALVQTLSSRGFRPADYGLVAPGSRPGDAEVGSLVAMAASAHVSNELADALVTLGVPEGEARFYGEEAREGRTLLVVNAGSQPEQVRKLVMEHSGYDVRSRGRELARANGGVAGGTGGRPVDLTGDWTDVASRYEMLFGQHYGTTDATWPRMEPIYRWAWEAANEAPNRGRPWSEVEAAVRDRWRSESPDQSWDAVAGPIRDVWEDVADEAAGGAEGGADRRIARQGTDQSVAASALQPPREGTA